MPAERAHLYAFNYLLVQALADECSEAIYSAKKAGIIAAFSATIHGIQV
jgi:hypothetical protein